MRLRKSLICLDRLLLFKSQTFDRWSLIAIIDCSLNDSLWRYNIINLNTPYLGKNVGLWTLYGLKNDRK